MQIKVQLFVSKQNNFKLIVKQIILSYQVKQGMYSLQKPILQNPFHPLDLSPQDLLRIYNRFQQSRKINKNPQQQLSIDTISQLISSLKGIKPSYIQKCITQSFIKPTISWNDFLTLLDHQSQIRQKILDWVLFSDHSSISRYKLKKYMPFRNKIQKYFDYVTLMKFIKIADQNLCIIQIDNERLILVDVADGTFKQVDRYQKKNSKTNLQTKDNFIQSKNCSKMVNKSKVLEPFLLNKKIGLNNSLKLHSQRLVGYGSFQTAGNLRSSQLGTNQDQQVYFKKERKNIHSVFNIFKDLQIQESIGLANLTAAKIYDRSFNALHANSIRDTFGGRVVPRAQKIKEVGPQNLAPFARAQMKLKSLYQQKSKLSYNPYRVKKSFLRTNDDLSSGIQLNEKKAPHERKQKNYILQSVAISYCPQISCLGIAYHNMQILILKVGKELNKTAFEEQDTLRILLERDHKKNQTIQSVRFYHHTIRDKWFLLVLIRVQFKAEGRSNAAQSYILGYQVEQMQNKRKGGFNYGFKCNRERLCPGRKETFCLSIDRFQGTVLQVQPRFGIHVLSFNGKYFTFRQEYIQDACNPSLTQYWKLNNQQKFKNSNFALSCISVSDSINKVLFGTNNGSLVLYDPFSHQFKTKKISPRSIVKVEILHNEGFALTVDQKIVVLNLAKFQQIHSFSTVNEEKLHQKVINFEFQPTTNQIWTFGSEIKIYDRQTNQGQLHKKRQMEKTYTWRLNKLKSQTRPKDLIDSSLQAKARAQTYQKQQEQPKLNSSQLIRQADLDNSQLIRKPDFHPAKQAEFHRMKHAKLNCSQLIIASERYFLVLSQILQVIVIEKTSLKVKFSFILNVPYDSKVMKIAISQNQKLLAVLLFNQSIYIYNIYTQELYLYLKPSTYDKFLSLVFLDSKNQYLLASGTQSGKIAMIPYSSVPQKPIYYLKYHTSPVNIVQVKNNYLVSCCEGGKMGIWQLPFNVIRNELSLPTGCKYIHKLVGFYSNKFIYYKTADEQLFQVNLSSAKLIKSQIVGLQLNSQINNVMTVDSITNQLFLATDNCLTICSRNPENNQWVSKSKLKIFDQKSQKKAEDSQCGEVLEIGIVGSQKAVLFYEGGGALVYNYQTRKMGKYITFNQ